jgi:SAM-dependent methyltransferase
VFGERHGNSRGALLLFSRGSVDRIYLWTMNFYDRLILPRLIQLAMRSTRLAAYRREAIGAARGLVLEIGVGSGLNLPLYGSEVDRVCGIDPSPELLDRARNGSPMLKSPCR